MIKQLEAQLEEVERQKKEAVAPYDKAIKGLKTAIKNLKEVNSSAFVIESRPNPKMTRIPE